MSSVETGVGEGSGQVWCHARSATVVMTTCLQMTVIYVPMVCGIPESLPAPCVKVHNAVGTSETQHWKQPVVVGVPAVIG